MEVRMTQSDGAALSGLRKDGGTPLDGAVLDTHRRRRARRGLVALPVVALGLMLPATPAVAQTTGTSGYGQTAPAPKTTTTPKSGTAPSKEATTPTETTPKASTEPSTTPTTTPTTTTPAQTSVSPASESKLPFTGLNLNWVIGAGLLLLAAGLSIRVFQRRQRHGSR
jgi:hypothetical protein